MTIEILHHNNIYYHVAYETKEVDESFTHAFGIERGYSIAVDCIEIFDAWNYSNEDVPFDNEDKELIYDLTKLLEDQLNG